MENTENKVTEEITETKTPETKAPETENKVDESTKDKEIANLKRLLSEKNSEAADWKRKLRERQTEEERKAAEIEEQRKAEQAELAQLRKEKQIASFANEFMALGMDKETATLTAQAKSDGDDKTVFANLKTLTENISQSALAKAMDGQSGLSTGNVPKALSAEDKIVAAAARYAGVTI